jgi:hypothetical protein
MVHAASLRGVLQDSSHQPISQKEFLCLMKYADGTERREPIKTDAAGAFKLERLTPGAVSLSFETRPAQLEGQRAQMEIKPGAEANAGAVVLSPAKRVMISGRLVASPTFSSLEGFKIRLDLEEWAPMLATDEQGRFAIPAKPGKHRLTAYLPYNGRTDRGVGHVEVEAGDDGVKDVKLPLETLSTVHMRIVDPSGKPLEGISAAAWWTPDHSGVFTEGTKSDSDGMATLYMYPGEDQFVGAHDWSGKYRLKADRPLKPEKGQVIKDLTVAMLPADTQE